MKTTRKKMLLSSIAMLLVALVALGSATYAWFTLSKTVSANGMDVQVISQAGLEINNETDASGWKDATWSTSSVSFTQDSELFPVSMSTKTYSGKGYIPAESVDADGKSYTGTYKKADVVPSLPTGAAVQQADNDYFAVYKVAYRSAQGSGTAVAHTGIKAVISYTDTNNAAPLGANFVRAALLDSTGAVVATYGSETGAEAVKAGSPDTTGTLEAQDAFKAFGSGETAVANTAADGTPQEYTLVTWFEGYDGECVNTNKLALGSFTISFTFTD